jgi:hypothetical protein
MAGMVSDPRPLRDERGDARQRPEVGAEPVRARSGSQRSVEGRELPRIQLRLAARAAPPLSPARPSAFHVWNQWWALTRVTPNAFATATCDSPRANSRAAFSRRASIAAKSRAVVGMLQHAIVPVKFVSLFCEAH